MDADSLLQCPESTFLGTTAIFALAAYSSTEGDLPVYSTQETTTSFLEASQGGYSMDPTLKIHPPNLYHLFCLGKHHKYIFVPLSLAVAERILSSWWPGSHYQKISDETSHV